MSQDILFALWFMLPAAIANAMPVFASKLPFFERFNAPIDGGRYFRGKRIFGSHKTWRGLASGIVGATLIVGLQQLAAAHIDSLSHAIGDLSYLHVSALLLGPLFAIGALGGDALKSFFKRQLNVSSGKPWPPFDQIDYIIGTLLITIPIVRFSLAQYLWMIALWFVAHLTASYIGWLLGLKKDPI